MYLRIDVRRLLIFPKKLTIEMGLGIKSPGTCAQVFCHFLGELESKPAAFKSQGCVYEGRLQLLQNLLMKISCPFLYLGGTVSISTVYLL